MEAPSPQGLTLSQPSAEPGGAQAFCVKRRGQGEPEAGRATRHSAGWSGEKTSERMESCLPTGGKVVRRSPAPRTQNWAPGLPSAPVSSGAREQLPLSTLPVHPQPVRHAPGTAATPPAPGSLWMGCIAATPAPADPLQEGLRATASSSGDTEGPAGHWSPSPRQGGRTSGCRPGGRARAAPRTPALSRRPPRSRSWPGFLCLPHQLARDVGGLHVEGVIQHHEVCISAEVQAPLALLQAEQLGGVQGRSLQG